MWKIAGGRPIQGTDHLKSGLPCQDSCDFGHLISAGEQVFAAFVSDGAGSATHSQVGSSLLTGSMLTSIAEDLQNIPFADNSEDQWRVLIQGWIDAAKKLIREEADASGTSIRDYASTLTAWPLGLVSDTGHGGGIVGYTMPKVTDSKDVHILARPITRQEFFQDKTFSFLVRTALNLSACVQNLHESGIIIGDVNESNFTVRKADAVVMALDTPSFQIKNSGKIYRCLVGKPEFTSPEMQGRNFQDIDRTENHDLFGLAVLIFQMLMMGRHPFYGIQRFLKPNEDALPTEKLIQRYLYFYSRLTDRAQAGPPAKTLMPADVLSPRLVEMFERAFSESGARNGRPTGLEWFNDLQKFEKSLIKASDHCSLKSPAHVFWSELRECPWCRISRIGARDPFWTVGLDRINNNFEINIDEFESIWAPLEQLLKQLRNESYSSMSKLPATKPCTPTPLPQSCDSPVLRAFDPSWSKWDLGMRSAMMGSLIGDILKRPKFRTIRSLPLLLMNWVELRIRLFSFPIYSFFVEIFMKSINRGLIGTSRIRIKLEIDRRARDLERARRATESAWADYRKEIEKIETSLDNIQAQSRTRKQSFIEIKKKYENERSSAMSKLVDIEKHRFLERFELAEEMLRGGRRPPGVGPTSVRNMLNNGIENAADVLV